MQLSLFQMSLPAAALFTDPRWGCVPQDDGHGNDFGDSRGRWEGVGPGDIEVVRKFVEDRIGPSAEQMQRWGAIVATAGHQVPDFDESGDFSAAQEAIVWFLDVFCLGRRLKAEKVETLLVLAGDVFKMREGLLRGQLRTAAAERRSPSARAAQMMMRHVRDNSPPQRPNARRNAPPPGRSAQAALEPVAVADAFCAEADYCPPVAAPSPAASPPAAAHPPQRRNARRNAPPPGRSAFLPRANHHPGVRLMSCYPAPQRQRLPHGPARPLAQDPPAMPRGRGYARRKFLLAMNDIPTVSCSCKQSVQFNNL